MRDLIALERIGDYIGTFEPGQHFRVLDNEYADLLIAQKRARPKKLEEETGIPDWHGATVVIIASGPSLTPEQCEQVRKWQAAEDGRKVIAINTTFRLAPWADLIYACDENWWAAYCDEVKGSCRGQLWTQNEGARKRDGIQIIQSVRGNTLCKKAGTIHQGMNSGFQAINLAYHAGVKRIILLGFDMKATDGKKHWHGDHVAPMNNRLPFALWISNFGPLAKDLFAEGIEVINATPSTALKCFPVVSLREALEI